MPGYDPRSAALAISLGGVTLGAALALATPTQMRMPPDPPWRSAQGSEIARETASEGAAVPWFSGDTYEPLPARAIMRKAYAEYTEPALPPPEAPYGDDGAWTRPEMMPEAAGDVVPAQEERAELQPQEDGPWGEEVGDDTLSMAADAGDDASPTVG